MACIFVRGSTNEIGLMAGRLFAGHGPQADVPRAQKSAKVARRAVPQANVVFGDVSTIAAMHLLAERANALGCDDAIMRRS